VLGDGVTGLRVLTAMFDPEGRPGSVSDLISLDGGRHQETAGGRIEPDGRMHTTYWLTEGERHTPRVLTAQEEDGLRRLAAALREKCRPSRGKGESQQVEPAPFNSTFSFCINALQGSDPEGTVNSL
jgi:hypothetical protein